MTAATLYIWIKALHVASIIAFVAGVSAQALFLAAVRTDASAEVMQRFRLAERRLTAPALIVALTSGVTLAALGRWFPAPWIVLKMALVVALLAIHGVQSGRIRRLAVGQAPASSPLPHAALAVAAIIAILAVLKPELL